METWEEELEAFKRRTKKSARAWEAAKKSIPFGVNSNYRLVDPYPLYIRKAKGSRIWDADGHEYTDFNMAFGALVAGHSHPVLAKAMRERVSSGTIFGFESVDAGPLAPGHAQSRDEEQDRILEAAELVEMLARALHAAHAEGIIHGGLNPGKVRITPAGVPKITSFRRVRLPDAGAPDLHPESDIRRVAGYLAPEQLEGRRRTVGPASDVYALGAILYTLLAGEPPFLGHTLQATIAQACTEAPVSPRLRQPSIPEELEAICLKCLAKPPSARFATAAALADALRQVDG